MKPKMIIMRGLPGSGKDTLLCTVLPKGGVVCSADDFFMEGGEYKFVPWKIGHAHESCKLKCFRAMTEGKHVAISNTNTQKWEYRLYLEMAVHFGYTVEIHNLFDGGCTDAELAERNVHSVPEEVIGRMRQGYEHPDKSSWCQARLEGELDGEHNNDDR